MASKDMSVDEMREWLESRGIKFRDAEKLANQVKATYPFLHRAVKEQGSPRADLEIIQLVHDVRNGRFPPNKQE